LRDARMSPSDVPYATLQTEDRNLVGPVFSQQLEQPMVILMVLSCSRYRLERSVSCAVVKLSKLIPVRKAKNALYRQLKQALLHD
jgi:hypothetical protein